MQGLNDPIFYGDQPLTKIRSDTLLSLSLTLPVDSTFIHCFYGEHIRLFKLLQETFKFFHTSFILRRNQNILKKISFLRTKDLSTM